MKSYNTLRHSLNLSAAIALLAGISVEVLSGDHQNYSRWYLWLQFVVCIIFICDFIGALRNPTQRQHRLRNFVLLLLSIPLLNIFDWLGISQGRELSVVLAALPLVRSFVAMAMVVHTLIDRRVTQIFGAYLFTVLCSTYLSALIFYDYESLHNPNLHGFGNAFWWACMNVTTVGAAIFPVTTIGKALAVFLPSLGMMFFPIFTLYVTDIYTVRKNKGDKN